MDFVGTLTHAGTVMSWKFARKMLVKIQNVYKDILENEDIGEITAGVNSMNIVVLIIKKVLMKA